MKFTYIMVIWILCNIFTSQLYFTIDFPKHSRALRAAKEKISKSSGVLIKNAVEKYRVPMLKSH